ncbi:MAG: RecQ family ATP-dependent DNA helicase [Chitinophagaceae bacterium]|nr:RecQ family ATP-dependent DNA helicase [Chitinophagaceae bacterium]
MQSIHAILKDYWGYTGFRPLQEDIINCVLQGDDCLALLPTGGGKSICFQIPAMAKEGLCLVVTPLIALMKDQVENLRRKGITSFAVYSGMTRKEVMATLKTAGNSNCKFLYVSPERLETTMFREFLPSLGVSLIAVDEAHCISQWGYDFRPSYLRIADLRQELPGIPVLALTASATPEVQKDICEKLLFRKFSVFRQSFERPNLSYSVFNVSGKVNKIIDVLNKVPGTAIVYCRSRKKTKEISDLLVMKEIAADFYHAGLSQDVRNEKQENWLKDKTRVIVCTNAFGMGIDKPGVRVVIHADVPECLENYYQEAGRAGRDGKRAYAVLLAAEKEVSKLSEIAEIKFPGKEEIRNVYKALMNHLQVPAGSGQGNYYEIDLSKFISDFKLKSNVALSAMKILEQEEVLYFSEQVFIQSKIEVLADRRRLLEFEEEQEKLEPVLKTLLRTYEGVTDQPVNINERVLAVALKKDITEIVSQLNELHKYGIVSYAPRKEKPQVYLFHNREKAADLYIDMKRLAKRKKQFSERVGVMMKYVQAEKECRSVIIGNYFGDNNIQACGICDNCIERRKKKLALGEFEEIGTQIMSELARKATSLAELLSNLKIHSKEKVKEVVYFLMSEEKIFSDDLGKFHLKNTSASTATSASST